MRLHRRFKFIINAFNHLSINEEMQSDQDSNDELIGMEHCKIIYELAAKLPFTEKTCYNMINYKSMVHDDFNQSVTPKKWILSYHRFGTMSIRIKK